MHILDRILGRYLRLVPRCNGQPSKPRYLYTPLLVGRLGSCFYNVPAPATLLSILLLALLTESLRS